MLESHLRFREPYSSFFCVALSCFRSVPLAIFAMFIAVVLVGWFYDLPRTSALTCIVVGISRNKVKRLLITCLPAVVAGIAVSASASIPRQYLSSALGDSALGVYSSIVAPITYSNGGLYLYNPCWVIFRKVIQIKTGILSFAYALPAYLVR